MSSDFTARYIYFRVHLPDNPQSQMAQLRKTPAFDVSFEQTENRRTRVSFICTE